MPEQKRKGFLDLCDLLKTYKRKVTYGEILEAVCKDKWYSDFKRIGDNTVKRAIKRHNDEYQE